MESKKQYIEAKGQKYKYNKGMLKISGWKKQECSKIDSLCQIKGLENLKDLKRIDLSHNEISNLECWKKLDEFEEINLSFNNISDISPLLNLKDMKILFINGNNIDIDQIEQFRKKRPDVKFNIDHVIVGKKRFYYKSRINHNVCKDITYPGIDVGWVDGPENIEGLGNYDNLHGLRIVGLSKFDGMENLTNLKALIIQEGHFTEIKGFGSLKNLEFLVLEQPFEVVDLKPLRHLHNLRYLFLGGTVECYGTLIARIEGLKSMTKLKRLTMPFCSIEKIEGLEHLRSLEILEIFENYISKIEGLENLEQLEHLNVVLNEICKIEGLESLKDLTELNLSHNKISKIEGLDKLQRLKHLDLRGNQISKIEGMNNLPNLEWLDLAENRISKIEGLENLPKLEKLWLYDNNLSNKYYKKRYIAPFLHPSVNLEKLKLEI